MGQSASHDKAQTKHSSCSTSKVTKMSHLDELGHAQELMNHDHSDSPVTNNVNNMNSCFSPDLTRNHNKSLMGNPELLLNGKDQLNMQTVDLSHIESNKLSFRAFDAANSQQPVKQSPKDTTNRMNHKITLDIPTTNTSIPNSDPISFNNNNNNVIHSSHYDLQSPPDINQYPNSFGLKSDNFHKAKTKNDSNRTLMMNQHQELYLSHRLYKESKHKKSWFRRWKCRKDGSETITSLKSPHQRNLAGREDCKTQLIIKDFGEVKKALRTTLSRIGKKEEFDQSLLCGTQIFFTRFIQSKGNLDRINSKVELDDSKTSAYGRWYAENYSYLLSPTTNNFNSNLCSLPRGIATSIYTDYSVLNNNVSQSTEVVCVDKTNKIYVCDIGLTEAQCDLIIQVSERCSRGRYASYTYAKQTLGCREYDELAIVCEWPVMRAISTITKHLESVHNGQGNNRSRVLVLDQREPHVVKYDVSKKERQKLDTHTDKSEWTFLIALSDGYGSDYDGGGTYFECIDSTCHIQKGHCLIFPGKLRHRGQKIICGRRFLLVGFLVEKDSKRSLKQTTIA